MNDLLEGFKQIEDEITKEEAMHILNSHGHVSEEDKMVLNYEEFKHCMMKRWVQGNLVEVLELYAWLGTMVWKERFDWLVKLFN